MRVLPWANTWVQATLDMPDILHGSAGTSRFERSLSETLDLNFFDAISSPVSLNGTIANPESQFRQLNSPNAVKLLTHGRIPDIKLKAEV